MPRSELDLKELADIGSLRAFVAVTDAASFVEGAKRLGQTRSAAGKAIARLEELLGTRLLHRTTRRVGLTADGQVFYDRAVRILADLDDAQRTLQCGTIEPRGVLRVTATEAFGRQVVLPVIGDCLSRWSNLSVEARFTDRVIDIVEEGFDVAVRVGNASSSPDLVARVVARSYAQLCASPVYLEQSTERLTVEEVGQHRQLLSGTRDNPRAWLLQTGAEPPVRVPPQPVLLSDNAGALRDAARAGLGVACLPQFLIEEDIARGELVCVLPTYTSPEIPISVVYPSRRHLSPKVRGFIDLLAERLVD